MNPQKGSISCFYRIGEFTLLSFFFQRFSKNDSLTNIVDVGH